MKTWTRNEFFSEVLNRILSVIGAYIPEGETTPDALLGDVECPEAVTTADIRRTVAVVTDYLTGVLKQGVTIVPTGIPLSGEPQEVAHALLMLDAFTHECCPATSTPIVDHAEATINFGHYAVCTLCMFRVFNIGLCAFLEALKSGTTFEERMQSRTARYDSALSDLRSAATTAN